MLDPVLLASHLERLDDEAPGSRRALELLRRRALDEGPTSLSPVEWRQLAQDRESMERLHREAWQHWPVESWDAGRGEPRLPPEERAPKSAEPSPPSSTAQTSAGSPG